MDGFQKCYEWIACESRKTAFNFGSDTNHIRRCGIRIRILPRLLTTADFDEIWCRDGAYTTGKSWVSCRSSRSKVKVKHNNKKLTEMSEVMRSTECPPSLLVIHKCLLSLVRISDIANSKLWYQYSYFELIWRQLSRTYIVSSSY